MTTFSDERSSGRLKPGFASLRAHDVHQGLQAANVDRWSGLLGEELEATQLVGMAAALATAIKGMDVIDDGGDLRRVADQQLDISPLAFDRVIRLLEETEYVRNVERDAAGRLVRLYETIAEDFSRLYGTLDEVYEHQQPGEVELSLVEAIDELSMGPLAIDDLDIDPDALERVLDVADHAEAIKVVERPDFKLAYSPFFAYENPEVVGEILGKMDVERVRAAYGRVRSYQGRPVLATVEDETLNSLIAAGLVAGPSVERPDGNHQAFAIAPYGLPPDLLTVRRPILDKAMAILAAVRTGQHFGGITSIADPRLVLRALLTPDRWVARHSSTARQYSVLWQMGIVRFQGGAMKSMQLINTPDNRLAVQTAIDLLTVGEAFRSKEQSAQPLFDPKGNYRTPIQTIKPARKRRSSPEIMRTMADLWDTAMGFRPSV